MPEYPQGYIPTPPALLGMLRKRDIISELPSQFKSTWRNELCTPYKAVQHFFKKAFEDDPQKIGDCTSHGARNSADISRAVEIFIKKEPEEWVARGATEGIYSYRGHRGQDGMNPGLATEFLHKYGILYRQKYPFADLSKYNPMVGVYAGGKPVSKVVADEARKSPCKHTLALRTCQEVYDALKNGFGIHGGSRYGNNGVRDAKGFSRWNDSWNHDFAIGAVDEQGNVLGLNSWGIWNRGGHPDWGPIPGGSFMIYQTDFERMVKTGEFYVVADVIGPEARTLPDFGSSEFLG